MEAASVRLHPLRLLYQPFLLVLSMSNIASIAFWQRERTAVRDSLENQVKSLAISRRAMTESFPQRNFPEAMLNLVEQNFQQVLATIVSFCPSSSFYF